VKEPAAFMGIDVHALNFIRYAAQGKGLGRVATMGRQSLEVPELVARFGHHCEEFLSKELAATLVDSYDYSDYEGATHIVDMNKPIIQEGHYDTVIDCGCLEHVYNAPQALKNVSQLCKIGGQIIHVLPANNFCGHGFWQFSPELFFSLYANANGYNETQVFMASLRRPGVWFEVVRPQRGRAGITSKSPLYVMCRTVKSRGFTHENIQQSDYIQLWNADNKGDRTIFRSALKAAIKKNSRVYRFVLAIRSKVHRFLQTAKNPTALSGTNRHLRKRYVSELLSG
jgi:SAM-dependent methyltransferase